MTHRSLNAVATLLTLAAGLAVAQAQTPAAKPAASAAPASEFDKFVDGTKKPADWFAWGADLRLRNEYLNNASTLGAPSQYNEQDYFRFRGRVWASFLPVTNVSLNARFSGEPREYMKPTTSRQYAAPNPARSGFEEKYGILDNANVKWNNALNTPLSITAGRQDIQIGETMNWWLVADGTPLDGSWTFFLDSVRLGYDAKELKTKFDAAYIYQNAAPDEWIPTLGRSSENRPVGYYLTEQTEQGVIVNAANKSIEKTQIEGFFIYKRDNQELANGDNADIYTVGAKVSGDLSANLRYSVEGAYQFGTKQDPTLLRDDAADGNLERDIRAFGVNTKLSYLFRDKLNNTPYFFYELLSGDDPSTTGEDEMFDILWGRYPRWSEMYIYSYAAETGGKPAQMNNVHRVGVGWSLEPMKNMSVLANYSALFAYEDTPTRATNPALFSQDGNFRGHYIQAILKHKFNRYMSGHLWGEFVWMGDYYANKDLMSFLRAELLFAW